MKKIILLIGISCLLSCSGYRPLVKNVKSQLSTEFFDHQFSGLFVYDPISGDTLINYNGNKYFTPASNTKIFTLYTAMSLLPEYLPTAQYVTQQSNLYIQGLGNPATLHPVLKDSSLIKFLKKQHNIHLYYNNLNDAALGPGWAWDDYDAYYSVQRSPLPLYGNVVNIFKDDSLYVSIEALKNHVSITNKIRRRALSDNQFYLSPNQNDTIEVPFIADSSLIRKVLENKINKPIKIVNHFPEGKMKTLYGIAADSVYKRLMLKSDNFIAEQLLIMASSTLGETLSSKKARDYILDNNLKGIQYKPRWVDGSGLSRYNLFTPSSMVYVLNELYKTTPITTLFNFFPTGGKTGTLEHYFKGNPRAYIHAKTGSLSNNYCLSGYLVTNSEKTLIFSFMVNHYRHSSDALKAKMAAVLEHIRDHY